jgi:hypothetical protein
MAKCLESQRTALRAGCKGLWGEDEDLKLKNSVQCTRARIDLLLSRWFQAERRISVIELSGTWTEDEDLS